MPFCGDENALYQPMFFLNLDQYPRDYYVLKTEDEAKNYANTCNAESESIFEMASYKSYIGKHRGLLWVDGFYEPYKVKALSIAGINLSMSQLPLSLNGVMAGVAGILCSGINGVLIGWRLFHILYYTNQVL